MRWTLYFCFFVVLIAACKNEKKTLTDNEQALVSLFVQSYNDNLESTNPDSAIKLSLATQALSSKIDDPEIIFKAATQTGIILKNRQWYDSAMVYFEEANDCAVRDENDSQIAKSLYRIGDIHYYKKQYALAGQYFKQAAVINKKLGQYVHLATNYSSLGLIFQETEVYDSALFYYQNAGHLFDSINDMARKVIVMGNISDIYNKMKNYDMALKIGKQVCLLNDSLGNAGQIARGYNGTGLIYKNLKLYDTAINHFIFSLKYAELAGDEYQMLIAKFNMGEAYSMAGDFEKANPLLDEVYTFCLDNEIVEGQIRCLLRIGRNKKAAEKYFDTKLMFETGLSMAKIHDFEYFEKEFLDELIQVEIQLLESKVLEKYYQNLKQVEEHINYQELKTKIAGLDARYESTKKNHQIKDLKMEKAFYKTRNTLLIISILLVIVSASIVFIYLRKRNQLLKHKHLLSINENKLKQLSLEKAELKLNLRDEKIGHQKQQIEQKVKELMNAALHQGKLNALIHSFKESLKPLRSKFRSQTDKDKMDQVFRQIEKANNRDSLQEFDITFNELHPGFNKTLSVAYPDLSPREKQFCALISLNMKSKDIAKLLHLHPTSIDTARHRIRKKMNLGPDQNLTNYLMQF